MNILIVGAGSAIAEAVARIYAAQGHRLFLVARNAEKLGVICDDLQVRGAAWVGSLVMDANDYDRHEDMLNAALDGLGGLDLMLVSHGTLPDQEASQQSYQTTLRALEDNLLSVVSLLTPAANYFEGQQSGSIAVVSSVAGDRGRQSNYVYGTAKGGVSIFLQGLRNRLSRAGAQVLTIKPGFVQTPMTEHLNGSGPLWASPQQVAEGIVKAVDAKKDVVYLPGFWRLIMMVVCAIPERVFKKLSL